MSESFDTQAASAVVAPYSTGFDIGHQTMEESFPIVDPEFEPSGPLVLVQVRRVLNKTKSGIILTAADKTTEAWNTVIGKLIATGPLAFRNRSTAEPWPEIKGNRGIRVGDFVRFPRHLGDRLSIPQDDGGDPVVILLMSDHQLQGRFTGNPLKIRAFIE